MTAAVGVDVSAEWLALAAVDDQGAYLGGYRHERPRNLTPGRWRLKVARRVARFAATAGTSTVVWAGCRCGCSHSLGDDLGDGLDVVCLPELPRPRPLPGAADERLGVAFALAAAGVVVPA